MLVTKSEYLAEQLLDIGAVVLKPHEPFTWSSGMKSPIYCDNRMTMAFPQLRQRIAKGFVELIKEKFPDVDVIAGTATAGIPHAAWVSEALQLPMVYVRGSAKSHGKKKQIEGLIKPGQKTVVIEDLVSTGGSVLKAVQALREAGADVVGAAAIFTYELPQSNHQFQQAQIPLDTLTDFNHLKAAAHAQGVLNEEQMNQLTRWQEHPESEAWMD